MEPYERIMRIAQRQPGTAQQTRPHVVQQATFSDTQVRLPSPLSRNAFPGLSFLRPVESH